MMTSTLEQFPGVYCLIFIIFGGTPYGRLLNIVKIVSCFETWVYLDRFILFGSFDSFT